MIINSIPINPHNPNKLSQNAYLSSFSTFRFFQKKSQLVAYYLEVRKFNNTQNFFPPPPFAIQFPKMLPSFIFQRLGESGRLGFTAIYLF